jgi:uncharacterized protein (TIGR01777 family)
MKIVLTGGTGFIGGKLSRYLALQEYEIVALTRRSGQQSPFGLHLRFVEWDACNVGAWAKELEGASAIIHLAGEGIFNSRWTKEVKQRIISSRILSTRALVQALALTESKPSVFISCSAVGIYGHQGDAILDESAAFGGDFLAQLCQEWEMESHKASEQGVRVVNPRIGIVLGTEGGALARLLPIFNSYAGLSLGSGQQWFPWVHSADVVRGLLYPLENLQMQGAFNLVAPDSTTMDTFCFTLSDVLKKRMLSKSVRIPAFALNIALGESASALLASQRAIPKKLQEAGFSFSYPSLTTALHQILSQ